MENEPVNNIEPSFPDGMQKIDTSKIDQAKVKEMLDKLKNVEFSTGKAESYAPEDAFIEGVETGTNQNKKDDPTGTHVRIKFKG